MARINSEGLLFKLLAGQALTEILAGHPNKLGP